MPSGVGAQIDELELDDDTWLYKVEGLVFGPVNSKSLVHRWYSGEIQDTTPVGTEGGEFDQLAVHPLFAQFQPKVRAYRLQLEEVARNEAALRRTHLLKRLGQIAMALVVGAAICVGGFFGVQHYRAEQLADERERAARAEYDALLASVIIRPALAEISSEKRGTRRKAGRKPGKARTSKSEAPKTKKSGLLSGDEVSDGVASVFGGIRRCILKQMQRDRSSVPNTLILQFTIANDGTTSRHSLDDRFMRKEPIAPCLSKELAQIRYRPFLGEVRNVEYPITISNR